MNDLFVRIRFQLPSLPRAEKVIAEALLENPHAITTMTLAEISRESGCSETSIIRFCKRLGYSGYSDTKNAFIEAVAQGPEEQAEAIADSDDMSTILKKVFQSNVQTLNDTLVLADDSYEKALEALVGAKSIHFFGVGDAHAICQLSYMKFSRLGVPGSAPSDVMQQFVTAENLGPGDIALAVSYEGRSRNVVQALKIAKQSGATTICITKMTKSPMLRFSDITLFIAVNDLTVGRDKVTRRISDQFILDVLYLGYVSRMEKDSSRQLKKMQNSIDMNKI